jgi:hypothetical protein
MLQTADAVERDHIAAAIGHVFDGAALRCDLFQRVMQTVLVVQFSNTTPMLGISVKSAIRGTHGTAGQCGCMPL